MFLTPTAYFPPLSWFLAAIHAGRWTLEAHENYQKGGWRNRCRIATANGPLLLSIPLVGGKHQQMPIKEVTIDFTTDWQRQHVQTIQSAYGRAPYFEYFGEEVVSYIYLHEPSLWNYNVLLIQKILYLLNISVDLGRSDTFMGGDAGAKKTENAMPPYRQVFEERFGFQDGLSVLDALFCLGPELPLLTR